MSCRHYEIKSTLLAVFPECLKGLFWIGAIKIHFQAFLTFPWKDWVLVPPGGAITSYMWWCGVFLSTMGGRPAFDLQTLSADADVSVWAGLSLALPAQCHRQRTAESVDCLSSRQIWKRCSNGGNSRIHIQLPNSSALDWASRCVRPEWVRRRSRPRRAGGELRLWGVEERLPLRLG